MVLAELIRPVGQSPGSVHAGVRLDAVSRPFSGDSLRDAPNRWKGPAMTHGLRRVKWKDLLHLSSLELVHELSLSLPWLAASWLAAAHGHYVLALGASFMFFLTGLRQVHNAYHYALGISRNATEFVMFVLSILMLGSMHAVQLTHLLHHRSLMTEDDVEAASSRMPGW